MEIFFWPGSACLREFKSLEFQISIIQMQEILSKMISSPPTFQISKFLKFNHKKKVAPELKNPTHNSIKQKFRKNFYKQTELKEIRKIPSKNFDRQIGPKVT